jgi:hypothetical protein
VMDCFRGSETNWTGLGKDMCDLDCLIGSHVVVMDCFRGSESPSCNVIKGQLLFPILRLHKSFCLKLQSLKKQYYV